jgi:hypothetical protein
MYGDDLPLPTAAAIPYNWPLVAVGPIALLARRPRLSSGQPIFDRANFDTYYLDRLPDHRELVSRPGGKGLTPKARNRPYSTANGAMKFGTNLLYAPLRANPKIACIHNPKIMQY